MIWHMFKKDARLLWPAAAIVAALKWLNCVLLVETGLNISFLTYRYGWICDVALPFLELAGLGILVISAIQQDPFPGTTQDWLTRPISRAQWFGAKWLFVLLLGLTPLFVGDMAIGLGIHLPFGDVLAASLRRFVALTALICVPVFLVGIVTRTVTQALVLTASVCLIVALVFFFAIAQAHAEPFVAGSGYATAILYVLASLNAAALAGLFVLQTRWRSTQRVRWLAVTYLCLSAGVILLPWNMAVAMHRAVSGHAEDSMQPLPIDAARAVKFSDAVRFAGGVSRRKDMTMVWVPLSERESVTNGDSLWRVDHVRLHAVGKAADATVEATAQVVPMTDLASPKGRVPALYLNVPTWFFDAARAGHARIALTAFVTSFRSVAHGEAKSFIGGSIDGTSQCRLSRSEAGPMVHCVSTKPVGTCLHIARKGDPVIGVSEASCGRAYFSHDLPLWRDPYYAVQLPAIFAEDRAQFLGTATASAEQARVEFDNWVPAEHSLRTLVFTLDNATRMGTEERHLRSVDGSGAAARFVTPGGVVVDSRGNLFIVDVTDDVIRKVTSDGQATTFAGKAGEIGSNDGPGAEARFWGPRGIAIDAKDNLYVLDQNADRIRKISPAGLVSSLQIRVADGRDLRQLGVIDLVVARDGNVYLLRSGRSAGLYRLSPEGGLINFVGPELPGIASPMNEP